MLKIRLGQLEMINQFDQVKLFISGSCHFPPFAAASFCCLCCRLLPFVATCCILLPIATACYLLLPLAATCWRPHAATYYHMLTLTINSKELCGFLRLNACFGWLNNNLILYQTRLSCFNIKTKLL